MSICIQDLRFSYPASKSEITIPQLEIKQGECVALVGPSGLGKTTLLNLISGNLRPKQGKISIFEKEIVALSDKEVRLFRLRNIGVIFQTFELLDYLNVRDNVLLQARLAGFTINKEIEDRAYQIICALDLESKWKTATGELSQGEAQRVATSRAMLLSPKIILADEPTGNLDPNNKLKTIYQLIEHTRNNNHVLITVTHDHSILDQFDRVIDMSTLVASIGSPSKSS